MSKSSTIGPGAIQDTGANPKPMLEGMTDQDYVVILNPMTVDFMPKFAVTIPVNAPVRIGNLQGDRKVSESEAIQRFGVPPLSNPDKSGNKHISHSVTIPANRTFTANGAQAQVIVKQLVTALIQRDDKLLFIADPHVRRKYEQMVIMRMGPMSDLMQAAPVSQEEQFNKVIEEQNEQEFPGISDGTGEATSRSEDGGDEGQGSGEEANIPERRGPGRPRKNS
jgi:hypothetical protein